MYLLVILPITSYKLKECNRSLSSVADSPSTPTRMKWRFYASEFYHSFQEHPRWLFLSYFIQFGFNLSFRGIAESLNESLSSFFVQINWRCVYSPSYFLISHQKQAGFEVLGHRLETVEQDWCRDRLVSPCSPGLWAQAEEGTQIHQWVPQKPSPPLHQCMTYELLPRSFSVHFRSSKSTAHEETQCSFESAPKIRSF